MKINFERLSDVLNRSLSPIYLLSGNEILLTEEGSELIRKKLKEKGFTDRMAWQAHSHFDWNQLLESMNSLSLFSTQSLLEIRLLSNKISENGKKVLLSYAENPPDDKVLLLITNKLDGPTQNTKWFKAIEKVGVCVTIWPIKPEQLPSWIQRRLQRYGMRATPETLRFIADKTEGNVLAAKQEIEKLYLLFDKKELTLEDVMYAATNNSRFDIFDLADAALAGNSPRTLRIIQELQEEGTEQTLLLWALAKEIRSLITMTEKLQKNLPLETIMQEHYVWDKRKPLIRASLKRHNVDSLLELLQYATEIDRMIKGVEPNRTWDHLNQLALSLSEKAS